MTLIDVVDAAELATYDRRQWATGREPGSRAYRSQAQRDRDRILYSSAFQRLAYVTQATAPEAGHAFHNRLSHSLKVAQVGRRNAERLLRLATTESLKDRSTVWCEPSIPTRWKLLALLTTLGTRRLGT